MALITHEIVPGQRLGPFLLGSCITDVLSYLQQHRKVYRRVEVHYDTKAVLESDISVVLPEHGQRLVFEPLSQRLRSIQIDDATRCCISYRGRRVFGGAAQLPTLGRVYDALGPTYPVAWDAAEGTYPLLYPGLLFEFPLPGDDGDSSVPPPGRKAFPRSDQAEDLSASSLLHFPVAPDVAACRMAVFAGAAGGVAEALAAAAPTTTGPRSLVHVEPGVGLFTEAGGADGTSALALELGAGVQTVLTQLGRPSTARPCRDPAGARRYVYSYPRRGLDVVFDARTHTVAKFVLHTNMPGSASFGLVHRCMFRVYGPAATAAQRGMLALGLLAGPGESLTAPAAQADNGTIAAPMRDWDAGEDDVANASCGATSHSATDSEAEMVSSVSVLTKVLPLTTPAVPVPVPAPVQPAQPAAAPLPPLVGRKKGKAKGKAAKSRLGAISSAPASSADDSSAVSSLGSSPDLGTPLPPREPRRVAPTISAAVEPLPGAGWDRGGRAPSEGWSDGDDLAALVLAEESMATTGGDDSADAATQTAAVQADLDVGGSGGGGGSAAANGCCWSEGEDGLCVVSAPAHDFALGGCGPFEPVSLQRDCGTQTRRRLSPATPQRGPGPVPGLRAGVRMPALRPWAGPAVSETDTASMVSKVFGRCRAAPLAARDSGGAAAQAALLHAYPGVVFETLRSGHIATVTVFAP